MSETKEKRQKKKRNPRRATRRDGSAASAGLRPGNPARPPFRGTGDGRRSPPGSAGVPPASSPFACRSVSLRCRCRPPAGGNRVGPAEAEPWRPCGSIRGEAMAEAAGRIVREANRGLHQRYTSAARRILQKAQQKSYPRRATKALRRSATGATWHQGHDRLATDIPWKCARSMRAY